MSDKGLEKDIQSLKAHDNSAHIDNFVFEKDIFSNVFEKDIRRVYIYKKAERLAKAIHLIAPAFSQSPALRNRIDQIAVSLVDAATLPPAGAREALSRELLTLSSVLSIARIGGVISAMNAEMIAREAHTLLGEIAAYEEPRLFLDEAPTLAALAKNVSHAHSTPKQNSGTSREARGSIRPAVKDSKGHVSDNQPISGRRDAILSVLRTKGPSHIKDISTVVREVSEKTIQRELSLLVLEGMVTKSGERRWTTYVIAS